MPLANLMMADEVEWNFVFDLLAPIGVLLHDFAHRTNHHYWDVWKVGLAVIFDLL